MESFNPENFLILIVDDVSKNLQVVGAMLDEVGYATTFATSGKQAIERVKTANPDLILLDLMMPEINGLQVCEHLKADPLHAEIPIIFLTASNDSQHLLQAFGQGAVDYVTKPYKAPELLARVKTHLELKYTRDELKKALVELETLATTDSLTGISNRRHLLTLAEREFQRAQRYRNPFSILMLDIDHFKSINDTYGHATGDEALKLMADVTRNALRQVDIFGRFGGEEFVVFLPETPLPDAVTVADRIREAIASVSVAMDDAAIRMTVSIGVATYQTEEPNLDTLLMRADKALYEAKQRGRDRVVADPTN
ncbi:diguanylate cyclase [Lyngbya sp. CCY1209]|uniref:diguanylate cyclase n=1 Tax=Lyngbya sp. CCY1209 TaxID=2886103 RepID=UPI002D20567F|nr:diguanylate cyclase [Lyngbya sp. CCY1209]MEB3887070.1 diguanylate cyclase [Lyngbya sp. CCY1209]